MIRFPAQRTILCLGETLVFALPLGLLLVIVTQALSLVLFNRWSEANDQRSIQNGDGVIAAINKGDLED